MDKEHLKVLNKKDNTENKVELNKRRREQYAAGVQMEHGIDDHDGELIFGGMNVDVDIVQNDARTLILPKVSLTWRLIIDGRDDTVTPSNQNHQLNKTTKSCWVPGYADGPCNNICSMSHSASSSWFTLQKPE
ncbi:hypothetical protein Leryth_018780 [Lithospermum erythrorhizon]|nr:hypothetical protein Leryth_018780 [Lithospermum erythrorhizon]